MTLSAGKEQILILTADPQLRYLLERIIDSTVVSTRFCSSRDEMETYLLENLPILGIFSEKLNETSGIELASVATANNPGMPVILFAEDVSAEKLRQAMNAGITEVLQPPLRMEVVVTAIRKGLEKANLRRGWLRREAKRATSALNRQLDELSTLAEIGQTITSTFDLDVILSSLVEAAVQFTNAEEGSLLLLDEETGELYMRAARNFQDEFVRTFRMKVEDSLISSILQNGEPFLLDENSPRKIKTSYFVHSLIYVPIKAKGRVMGLLGVDNRLKRLEFKEHEVKLLVMLADYAAIALDNADQYHKTLQERNKLDTILAKIQDGVIVVDDNQRLILINPIAKSIFNVGDREWSGLPLAEIIPDEKILDLVQNEGSEGNNQIEVTLTNEMVYRATASSIAGVGTAITFSDITHFKQLDRMKSDFVNTVSHDLRSPLMSILGYIELFDQVGPVNETQRDFIQRAASGVNKISYMISDLLDLGRIEAGIHVKKDWLNFRQLVEDVIEGHKLKASSKQVNLSFNGVDDKLPGLYANEIQIRQVIDNLLDNAIKYTPSGGMVIINVAHEQGHLIFQVTDTGPGIPPQDMPHVFEKFYTASNADRETKGTGLGLAIVKSVVESYQGQVRVDSNTGTGSTFTVILPAGQSDD